MDCAVGCLLFGSLDYFMVILLLDTALHVQKNHQKSANPKWPRLDQLDNRFYSTIQPPTFTTYNMKIEIRPTFLEFFNTLSQKSIRTTHQNSHQFLKKLNGDHWIGSSSPEKNPSGVLTNINLT